jgi:undecaprenyl-diphosphatase
MSFLQALILGLVQGATEFFPISSSAHLRMAKWLLGISDGEHLLFFDLLCHLGTLFALLIYLRKEIFQVLTSLEKIKLFFLALIPLVPAYFFLKPLRVAAADPSFLGYALMISSLLLFIADRKKEIVLQPLNTSKKWKNVLCIGLMQTIALVPGISRSGSTISAARLCGWEWKEAARFSFLLAIPTILGGQFLEMLKVHPASGVNYECYAGGFLSSFAFGLISVRFVFWIYEKEKVRPFAWYCLAAGLFAWTIFNG